MGLVCLVGASIGWPPWGPSDHIRWWSVLLRSIFLATTVVLYIRFLKLWLAEHADSVHRRWKVSDEKYPELGPLDDEGYFQRLEASSQLFRNLDVANATILRQHLLEPQGFRRKVTEDVEIRLQQFVRTVEIRVDPDTIPRIGSGVVLPIMRRATDAPLRELTVTGGRLLNSMETRALLVRIAEVLDIEAPDFAQEVEGEGVAPGVLSTDASAGDDVADVDTPPTTAADSRGSDPERVRQLMSMLIRGPRHLDRLRRSRHPDSRGPGVRSRGEDQAQGLAISEESKRLFSAARKTRHYIAWYDDPSVLEGGRTAFEYRSDPDRPDQWPAVDPWRARKDRWRTALRMPRRFVYVRLDKALSSHTYILRVRCDEDLYFEESNVWVEGRRWLKSANPFSLYRSYIYWEPPSGKSFTSLTASRIGGRLPWRSLYFALRLTEKPPGILGSAAAISFTSLVSVWLVGALGVGAQGIDPVAFILALPGLAASLLGFSTAGAMQGRRSGTGIGALAASMMISLLGVVLFVSEGRKDGFLKPWRLHEDGYPVSVLWMQDLWWVVLVVLAGCIFLVTLGTLIMRVQRYAVLTGVRSEKSVASAPD